MMLASIGAGQGHPRLRQGPARSRPAARGHSRAGLNAPRAVPKSVLSEHPVHAGLPKRVLNAPKAPFGEMLSEHSGLYPPRRPRQSPKSPLSGEGHAGRRSPACTRTQDRSLGPIARRAPRAALRRRAESNRCRGLCRPLPGPLGHAAWAVPDVLLYSLPGHRCNVGAGSTPCHPPTPSSTPSAWPSPPRPPSRGRGGGDGRPRARPTWRGSWLRPSPWPRLAVLVGEAIEQIGEHLGPGPTGLLQSSLGNLPDSWWPSSPCEPG